MSRSKYESHVEPNLERIFEWARAGATYKEIAKKLHVSYTAFKKYVDLGRSGEERYKPLFEGFTRACAVADDHVEAALYKRACGYQYLETTQEQKLDRAGNVVNLTKTVKRDIPPDPTSAMFWLANRVPSRWQYKPQTEDVDKKEGSGVVVLPPVEPVEKGGEDA